MRQQQERGIKSQRYFLNPNEKEWRNRSHVESAKVLWVRDMNLEQQESCKHHGERGQQSVKTHHREHRVGPGQARTRKDVVDGDELVGHRGITAVGLVDLGNVCRVRKGYVDTLHKSALRPPGTILDYLRSRCKGRRRALRPPRPGSSHCRQC